MVAAIGLSVVAPVPVGPLGEGPVQAATETDSTHDSVIVFFDDAPSSTATLNAVTDETTLTFGRSIDSDTRVYGTSEPLSDSDLENLADDLGSLGNVVDVVPNVRVRNISTVVNDPGYPQQKSLTGAYGINPVPAWALTLGSGVKVAVLDTGIATGHPDLQSNIVGGFDFVSADGPGDYYTANDGNGWDADPSDPGDWCDLDASGNQRPNGEFDPSSWHGTHVAGTIAALQNNTDPGTGGYVGVTGVAPLAQVVPIRVMGRCGGYLSDLVSAMKWAVGITVSGAPANANPAKILNLSLGADQVCTTGLAAVVNEVTATGALVVAAAGNDNASASGSFPANCSQTLAVAATDDNGLRAWFSNYGSLVDIAAPGVGVVSTYNMGDTGPTDPAYARLSGTSMATPHVAGVAALVRAVNPALTSEQLSDVLRTRVTTLPAYPGTPPAPGATGYPSCDVANTCGSGILNAGSAVTFAAANIRPSEPRNVTAARSGRDVTVSWDAPLDTGTSAISSYTVLVNNSDACTTADGATLSCTVTGLALGTYTFTVVATNASGRGPVSSSSAAVTVVSPPSVVTGLSVVRAGRSVTVSWSAPTDSGGLTVDYVVVGGPSGDVTTSSTTHTFMNLTVGTSYSFGVKARNAEGEATTVMGDTVTIYSAPAAVTSVTAVRTDQSVTVSWDETPSTGGLSVEYVVVGGPAGEVTTTNLSRTFTSLTVGTEYEFGVKVRNSEGDSTTVFADPVTVHSKPSVPGNVKVTTGNLSATVSWSAPSISGGLPVDYVVSGGPGDNVVTSGTSHTFTGLQEGMSYAFSVTARNSDGLSEPVTLSPVTITATTTTTTTTVPAPPPTSVTPPTTTTTTSTTTTVPPAPVRMVKRGSKTAFSRIYAAPKGARTKWSARGTCSVRSPYVVASRWRGTCTVSIRQTLRGRTTTRTISLRVI